MTFDFPWVRMINPHPDEISPGKLVLGCEPRDLHLNHNQDINAGVLFSLAEMAGMGVVVTSLGEQANKAYVVVRRGVIDFKTRARGRIRATALLTESQLSRVQSAASKGTGIEEVVLVEILDESDRVVAQCEMTAVIRPVKA
jgi:acyl-coenzyme A thioesterase PaaI-like protein